MLLFDRAHLYTVFDVYIKTHRYVKVKSSNDLRVYSCALDRAARIHSMCQLKCTARAFNLKYMYKIHIYMRYANSSIHWTSGCSVKNQRRFRTFPALANVSKYVQ